MVRSMTLFAFAAALGVASSAFGNGTPPSGIFAGLSNLSNSASAEFIVGQDGVDFVAVLDDNFTDTANVPVTLGGGYSFGLEEENGVFGVTGSASASSVAGILRASASVTVTDHTVGSFDVPWLTETGDNEAGIPTSAGYTAFARFADRLQYGGSATSYTSRYLLRLTGSISETPGAFVAIRVQQGASPAQEFIFDDAGTFNQIVATEAFFHGGAPQELSVVVQATADAFPEWDFEGTSYTADFSSTFEIIGLELRDADTDELLTNETVTTFGGGTVPVSVVPEPGTAALAAAGLMLLARRRRSA